MSIANTAAADRVVRQARYRAVPDQTLDESLWRSLAYFSYYRLIVAAMFLGMILGFGDVLSIGGQHPRLFLWVCGSYLMIAVAALAIVHHWRIAFGAQLSLQVAFDILALTLLMHASGGAKSGIAMMILIVLVGAGLVGQGRMVLFYAALATLALLFEQTYRIIGLQGDIGDLFRTGITSIGFFGSAIAARLLARRVVANEELARRRGIELADQLRINERVIRDMQDGVLVVDAVGAIRQANPQARKLLGLADRSADSVRTLLSANLPNLANEYLTRRERGIESDAILRIPQSGRTLHARFLPPGEEGENALIFLEDMGRLQEEAQQLKLAALGRLTANLAHEIRNPLAAISHAAELLGEAPNQPGSERLARMIGDNVQRLNRLVSEVLELGRRDRTAPEPVALLPFVQNLREESALQDKSAGTRVVIDLPAELTVLFDRGHLHRILANLIGNALVYASPSPGAVRIDARRDEGNPERIQLRIGDDGPGVDREAHGKIFEPFFTTRSAGTGLGLYIARELAEANGARLFLIDSADGATFCLSCVACNHDLLAPEPFA